MKVCTLIHFAEVYNKVSILKSLQKTIKFKCLKASIPFNGFNLGWSTSAVQQTTSTLTSQKLRATTNGGFLSSLFSCQCMFYLTGYSSSHVPHSNLFICPSSHGNTPYFLTDRGRGKDQHHHSRATFCLSSWEKEPTDFSLCQKSN